KGQAKTGKTTTIRKILEQIFEIKVYHPTRDVVLSFKFKGKIIAIITMGDIEDAIKKYYDMIDNFDILICSCRTKGETISFYENKKQGCDIKFIKKTAKTDEDERHIISKVKEIIEILIPNK
ncbi:MAG: hypothetical protein AABY14_02415, partial [Nanoarchaeota archaeon]